MKRSGFRREPYARTRQALRPPAAWRTPQPVGDRVSLVPKSPPYRDPRLLGEDMVAGRPCLLAIPGVCVGGGGTTVACHSNHQAHGKGRGIKAGDNYTVWGCMACHFWYDQDRRPSKSEKAQAFDAAHKRQIEAWALIRDGGGRLGAIAGAALDSLSAPRG